MNTPNPLIPQGALDRQAKGKSTVRIAIFTIVSIHAVFFAGLLMQGCRQDENKAPTHSAADASTNQAALTAESGYYQSTQDVAQVLTPAAVTAGTSHPAAESASNLPSPTITDPAPDTKAYTVAKGDSLIKIANANGTTVTAITKANPNIDPARIRVGQKIQLPPAAASVSRGIGYAEPGKTEASNSAGTTHTVKAGETLTKVARQHGTTLKALRAANNLKSDRLVVGQKLKLPAAQTPRGEAKPASISKVSSTLPGPINPLASNTR
ncbi:MAG: LysM peptidoglycan-binding domain-containing protein [Verrucomicrobiota bacterium]